MIKRFKRPLEMAQIWCDIVTGKMKEPLRVRIFFTLGLVLLPSCFLGWCIGELMLGPDHD